MRVAGLLVIATKACGGFSGRALRMASLKARAVLPEAEREMTVVEAKESARLGHGVSGSGCEDEGCRASGPRTWAFRAWEHSKRGLKTSSLATWGEVKSRFAGASV